MNVRLDEMQAGLLRVKLKHLEGLRQEREQIADRYLKEINILSITEKYADTVCSIPIYNGMKEEEIQFVIDMINRF